MGAEVAVEVGCTRHASSCIPPTVGNGICGGLYI